MCKNVLFTVVISYFSENLPRIGIVYILEPQNGSTFTWAMPNKSISVLPITLNFKKLFIVIKFLAKSLIVCDPLRGFDKDFITMNNFFEIFTSVSSLIEVRICRIKI